MTAFAFRCAAAVPLAILASAPGGAPVALLAFMAWIVLELWRLDYRLRHLGGRDR